jgi:hypothetical protein
VGAAGDHDHPFPCLERQRQLAQTSGATCRRMVQHCDAISGRIPRPVASG